jgi:hypothetical protein
MSRRDFTEALALAHVTQIANGVIGQLDLD